MTKYPDHFRKATDGGDWDFIVRSPGRINIIGEHTDYNGGLVLPAAIDKSIYFAVRRLDAAQLKLNALDLKESAEVDLPHPGKTDQMWVNYLLGITEEFRKRGQDVPGMELVFGSDLPVGAGVSSSAALEGGMAFICNDLCQSGYDRPELARICRASSNDFMGIPSGIMDQFASLNGMRDRAILLDCDTLEHEFVAAELPGYRFLLINSRVTHELGNSEYPLRVAECRRALEVLRTRFPELAALGHGTVEQLEAVKPEMAPVVYRRAKYVIEEMNRIRRAVEALKNGDAEVVGKAMNDTHAGLRDDYEVSCPEVDFLQTFAERYPGVAGSRIMGGGFGGCTINLLREEAVDAFVTTLSAKYFAAYDIEPAVYEVPLSNGTEIVG